MPRLPRLVAIPCVGVLPGIVGLRACLASGGRAVGR
jgi:hypothetical protein